MSPEQIAEARHLAEVFVPSQEPKKPQGRGGNIAKDGNNSSEAAKSDPFATGTGFFITDDGFFMTNAHVVKGGAEFKILTRTGMIEAKIVKVDAANDLALLKANGSFVSLPVVGSRTVRLGSTVATVGFPNIGMQGFAPKLAKGEIGAYAIAGRPPACSSAPISCV